MKRLYLIIGLTEVEDVTTLEYEKKGKGKVPESVWIFAGFVKSSMLGTSRLRDKQRRYRA